MSFLANLNSDTYSPIMSAQTILLEDGRVTIPKSERDDLHMKAGDALSISQEGDSLLLTHHGRLGKRYELLLCRLPGH